MSNNNQPIAFNPYLTINGAKISVAVTSATTHFDVSAGICRDQTNVFDLNIGNYLGLASSTASSNAVTNVDATYVGINGIDTGALAANKMYYVYVVADVEGPNPTGAMISLRAPDVGPIIPYGYSVYRHIGFISTNGSSQFYVLYHAGNGNYRTAYYDAPVATNITAGASTAFAAATLTNLVPLVDNNTAYVNTAFTPAAASRTATLQDANATAGGNQLIVTGQVASVVVTSTYKIPYKSTSSAATINYKVSNADSALAINVLGFDYFV
jgi:hypothetical protein